jgi:4'-phosphopantetheinyl transferase EntD
MAGAGGLGIDLEPDEPLPEGIIGTILTPGEAGLDARLAFAAKEALYKAQYPVSRTLFDFHAIAVTLGPGRFTGTVLRDVPGFPAGTRLPGQWARAAGHVVTALVI